jgi:hypothetical protein
MSPAENTCTTVRPEEVWVLRLLARSNLVHISPSNLAYRMHSVVSDGKDRQSRGSNVILDDTFDFTVLALITRSVISTKTLVSPNTQENDPASMERLRWQRASGTGKPLDIQAL